MWFLRSVYFILVLVFLSFDVVTANCKYNSNSESKFSSVITVDLNGQGNFTSVQKAIHFVPDNNTEWIAIYVGPGTYVEQVVIPKHKDCILLQGKGIRTTEIAYNAHNDSKSSATFFSRAKNLVAKDISFKNTYNVKAHTNKKGVKQAVAAGIHGDKSAFYNVGFYGYQDTLSDADGRHYFNSCYIEGAIDFIWGNGQSIYENCTIHVLGRGYLTAQGRNSSKETTGFVFKECEVTAEKGSGPVFLGRAWGAYSTVIFDNSTFSDVIRPEGWYSWYHEKTVGNLTYAEANCRGPGADTSKRVSWEKKLSEAELQRYTSMEFIDNEGWLKNQP